MKREHLFSPDRKYRYALWREWDMSADLIATMPGHNRTHEFLMVIGLNPSTADESKDDPTLRRCMDFAKRWGFGALCMMNLFAYRATNPRDMIKQTDPLGANNDVALLQAAHEAGMILCAWGNRGSLGGRALVVTTMLRHHAAKMKCLRRNDDGSPEHPLFVPADTQPIDYIP